MTSSPGPMPSAESDVISALVPLAVARQCFAPVSDAYADSKAATLLPRFHLPLRMTRTSASSSVASATGHDGNGVRRTGVPPRSAGREAWRTAGAEVTCGSARGEGVAFPARPVTIMLPRKVRRLTGFMCTAENLRGGLSSQLPDEATHFTD